jgi:hypothetical protein
MDSILCDLTGCIVTVLPAGRKDSKLFSHPAMVVDINNREIENFV